METTFSSLYGNLFRQSDELFHVAKLETRDPKWAQHATAEIDRILVETGIREHANGWVIDCRSTICTVLFDTAIADYDEDEATRLLMEFSFARATWQRRYRENTSYLILTRTGHYC